MAGTSPTLGGSNRRRRAERRTVTASRRGSSTFGLARDTSAEVAATVRASETAASLPGDAVLDLRDLGAGAAPVMSELPAKACLPGTLLLPCSSTAGKERRLARAAAGAVAEPSREGAEPPMEARRLEAIALLALEAH